jgi:hypothetical protein
LPELVGILKEVNDLVDPEMQVLSGIVHPLPGHYRVILYMLNLDQAKQYNGQNGPKKLVQHMVEHQREEFDFFFSGEIDHFSNRWGPEIHPLGIRILRPNKVFTLQQLKDMRPWSSTIAILLDVPKVVMEELLKLIGTKNQKQGTTLLKTKNQQEAALLRQRAEALERILSHKYYAGALHITKALRSVHNLQTFNVQELLDGGFDMNAVIGYRDAAARAEAIKRYNDRLESTGNTQAVPKEPQPKPQASQQKEPAAAAKPAKPDKELPPIERQFTPMIDKLVGGMELDRERADKLVNAFRNAVEARLRQRQSKG